MSLIDRLRLPLILCWCAVLAACASLPGALEVSQPQLEAALQRRFPHESRPAGLFVARVGVPRLQLLPEQNRVRLDFPVEASERVTRRTGRGTLGMSFAVRFEPSDATLRAVDVRTEDLELNGLPAPWREPLRLAGGLIAEGVLEGTVLHAFRPEELARARGRTIGNIRVTPTGVRFELVPA